MVDELPEGWEAWLAFFANALPAPVEQETLADGSVVFRAGDPGEVIVHLMPRTIVVSMFEIRRLGSGTPMIIARPVARVSWQRLLLEDATTAVERLVEAARAARRATFRVCEVCEQFKPPEAMHDGRTCDRCAREVEPPPTVH